MEAGIQQQLTVRQLNRDKKYHYAIWNNDSVTWTSSEPAVATVHDGVVAALSAGTAEITAQAGANTATFSVTVEGEAAHVHSMKYIDRIDPTYYENGREDYWLCTLCDHMYQEEEAVTEVTADELVIPKLMCSEHVWDGGIVTKAPASTREGNILYVCVNCSAEKNEPIPVNGKTAMHSGDLARAKPTVAQLTERINAITDTGTRFVEEPSVYAPYQTGSLTDAFLNSGLTYLNFIRYMAGLPEVYLDANWSENAQYGAVVLGAIDELTHYPKQPADMDDTFFEAGAEATASSNLSVRGGTGFYNYNVIQSSIRGCMDDSIGLDNLSGVGHRRWLLSPTLEKVGFGAAISRNKDHYVATKVFDKDEPYKRVSFAYNFISWPVSGNMSTNVFNNMVPWSITLNPEVYSAYTKDDLKITLTCVESNKVWTFDGNTDGPTTNENQYMIVNGEGYGDVASTIIFAPGSLYTSIIPNLLVDGILDAIRSSDALKVYACNIMTEAGETEGYTVSDHIRALFRHGYPGMFHLCLTNSGAIPQSVLQRYNQEGSEAIFCDKDACEALGVEIISKAVATVENGYVRHNPGHLARELMALHAERTIRVVGATTRQEARYKRED